ncbi:MAG TPA: hypothetical protein VGH32_07235 [Pirellulales bacterium]
MHESAGSVVSTLQTMAAAAKSTDDMKQGLQLLGRKAEDIRGSIGAAIDALGDFKRTMLTASSALSEAFKADAAQLHKLQEEVGGLRYRAESLSKEIEETGFFGARKKRELEAELQSVRQELEAKSGQADKLRAAVGKIEPILGEATWVEPSLDDLIGFLDKSRTVWTAFGSSLAQLVADASQDQLAEPAWMKRALGFDEAISQWQAIDRAAAEFTENALVDID